MASLTWYAYKSGSQYATVKVNYTENVYATHSTITVNSIRYYNSYTSATNSSGAPIYWTGLSLKITGSFGTHTVISSMYFPSDNCDNTNSMSATTPNITSGSSVSFVLSGTLRPNWDWGSLSRDPLTIGSSTGSSATTQSISTHGHSWSTTITKQPTCTVNGEKKHTCSSCGNSYTETIAASGAHNYVSKVVNPTCTSQGYTNHTCSVCGSGYNDTYTNALGHSYIDIVVPPNCTVGGYTTHKCSVCSDSYNDTYTNAIDHVYDGATCINCGASSVTPIKKICYIYDGEKWVRHYTNVTNIRRCNYVYKNRNPETAMLGFAKLGIMKLGQGG